MNKKGDKISISINPNFTEFSCWRRKIIFSTKIYHTIFFNQFVMQMGNYVSWMFSLQFIIPPFLILFWIEKLYLVEFKKKLCYPRGSWRNWHENEQLTDRVLICLRYFWFHSIYQYHSKHILLIYLNYFQTDLWISSEIMSCSFLLLNLKMKIYFWMRHFFLFTSI